MNDLEREFEEMVRANRSTIYTVCYMFSQDQDEVADLFQEVLINLWKSMPTFEGRSNVRSWIYRVSLNVCISLFENVLPNLVNSIVPLFCYGWRTSAMRRLLPSWALQ